MRPIAGSRIARTVLAVRKSMLLHEKIVMHERMRRMMQTIAAYSGQPIVHRLSHVENALRMRRVSAKAQRNDGARSVAGEAFESFGVDYPFGDGD